MTSDRPDDRTVTVELGPRTLAVFARIAAALEREQPRAADIQAAGVLIELEHLFGHCAFTSAAVLDAAEADPELARQLRESVRDLTAQSVGRWLGQIVKAGHAVDGTLRVLQPGAAAGSALWRLRRD